MLTEKYSDEKFDEVLDEALTQVALMYLPTTNSRWKEGLEELKVASSVRASHDRKLLPKRVRQAWFRSAVSHGVMTL